jgi:hypothetical protein
MAGPACDGLLPDGEHCPNEATHTIRVRAVPRSGYSKIIYLHLCQQCCDANYWAEVDQSDRPQESLLDDAGSSAW